MEDGGMYGWSADGGDGRRSKGEEKERMAEGQWGEGEGEGQQRGRRMVRSM